MNIQEITSQEAQKFMSEHSNVPAAELLLSAGRYPGLNIPQLVAQMEGRSKARKKLPSWYACEAIVYPSRISMEQCSSELTARYKASLIEGTVMADLTGGLGVDSWAFSERVKKLMYVERNEELCETAIHNFRVLGKNHIRAYHKTSEEFLHELKEPLDWIYLDPARRKEGSKVFRFQDCEPDVPQLMPSLFAATSGVMIKTSPLLDIGQGIRELRHVKAVHVVAVENECRELIFILTREPVTGETEIIAVNFRKDNTYEEFRFLKEEENQAIAPSGQTGEYLYEPNAAILKAGAFKLIAIRYGLEKLNPSSHLYTSGQHIEKFPGRSFKILKTLKYSAKEIRDEIKDGKANITVRNFPDSVQEIRKKTGLKDGGDIYLFATRDLHNKPVILITSKV